MQSSATHGLHQSSSEVISEPLTPIYNWGNKTSTKNSFDSFAYPDETFAPPHQIYDYETAAYPQPHNDLRNLSQVNISNNQQENKHYSFDQTQTTPSNHNTNYQHQVFHNYNQQNPYYYPTPPQYNEELPSFIVDSRIQKKESNLASVIKSVYNEADQWLCKRQVRFTMSRASMVLVVTCLGILGASCFSMGFLVATKMQKKQTTTNSKKTRQRVVQNQSNNQLFNRNRTTNAIVKVSEEKSFGYVVDKFKSHSSNRKALYDR